MKELFKNKKYKLYILVGTIFLLTFGVTYAYFSTVLNIDGEPTQMVTETGTLELNYADGDYITAENVYPGWTVTKTVSVTNIGTLDAYYKLFWKELTNTIERDELVFEAVCSSYKNYNTPQQILSGVCDNIEEEAVSSVVGSIRESIGIESGYTHVYTFTFKFKEVSSEQNYNQGKSFSGRINIDDSIGSYTMNGTLLDINGNSLGNTLVSLSNGLSATTDAQGKFIFENINEGNYTISVGELSNDLTLETGSTIGSEGTTITSNIENKEINVTIQLGNHSMNYDVTSSNEYDVKVLALYVDGVKVTSLSNTKNYELISSSCTNGETVEWNNIRKRISIEPMTSATKCTVNFNERAYLTLNEQMLVDNTAQSDASINFAAISSSTNGKGLYYTSDLTKTEGGERVYYYRGAVTNNYVQFAGFCWKIVRTNEDGSVKLMYWGPKNGTTCSTTALVPSSLQNKAFNSTTNDNRYVGYMYGSDCNSYTSCHSNVINSTIKGPLDTWYNTNITSEYRSKIANTKYCNDRSLYSGTGASTTETYYGPSGRILQGSSWSTTNANPQYNCPNDARDAFTLKVASGGTQGFGNNMLDYPVGLLTADEIVYAGSGGYNLSNNTYFLYTGNEYWLMSPFYFYGTYAVGWRVYSNGSLYHYLVSNANLGAFPVISINSSNLVINGEGTATEPYIVE